MGPSKNVNYRNLAKLFFYFKKIKNRFSGQFHIFWNTVSAISSKPFELKTWNFYTKQTSMGPSKNVNHRNLAKLFLQRFSDNFPNSLKMRGGPLNLSKKSLATKIWLTLHPDMSMGTYLEQLSTSRIYWDGWRWGV